MNPAYTKTHLGLAISCALALGIAGATAWAESNPAAWKYVTDDGMAVVTSGFGECWHTGDPLPLSEAMVPCEKPMAPPEEVAIVADPTPVPTPRMVTVTIDADTLFDFNKADLLPAGREALDAFMGRITDMSLETITAIGHADRIGSDGYNQRLSEQRANAVKSYLVGAGLQQDRIHASGMGEAQPTTKAGECQGSRSTRLIACLQPDRRVEIQSIGTTR